MDLNRFTIDGNFLMLALDHRASLKKLINPQNPEDVSSEDLIKLKSEIINAIEDQISGLTLDRDYGLKAYLGKSKPFLMPLEKSGLTSELGEKVTELEFNIEQIKNLGASGALLLIYFNPSAKTASKQLATVKYAMEECKVFNFPFFLEIVTYENLQLHPKGVNINLVLDSVKTFIDNGIVPDVFKLEYPESLETCKEITRILKGTPWILLTGGDTFDLFCEHLRDAISAGAKGFLAGRALWQEVTGLSGPEKEDFLGNTLPVRFKTITDIVIERR